MFDFFHSYKYRPVCVRLEACSKCQLNCPGCYMRQQNNCNIGVGYLTLENFKKFLDLNPYVREIELSNNGEIFLNPELVKIIDCAAERGKFLMARNGVNFNYVADDVLKGMAICQNFPNITLSIDGASQETYSTYRCNGNFDKVIENIRKLNEYKQMFNSRFPYLLWQYIIFEKNSDITEIKRAKQLAKELGVDIMFKKDWSGFVPKDTEEVERETGLDYSNKLNLVTQIWYPCMDLYFLPTINYDGRFLGCCANTYYSFKLNAFEVSLETILKSKEMRDMRNILTKKFRGDVSAFPCYYCDYYREIRKSNNFKKILDEYYKNIYLKSDYYLKQNNGQ